ncbi:MAG TPA: YceI family protein [Anaerolineales bacterium]|nr:YceI family protein [Anaerolineales bacterium]
MKKNLLIIGVVILVGIVAVVAYVLRPPAEATAPIEAIPLATATTVVAAEEPTSEPAPTTETVATEPTAETETEAYPAPGQESAQAESAYPAPEAGETTGTVVFSIVSTESQARFTLDEELRSVPTTVIGATDQVAGEIGIDFANPANSQLGIIQVNARTLTTDSSNRNRMIRNEILDTESFEFITFTPTALTGLPATIAVGDTVTFQVTGDLTIRDVTKSVTFDVTVTVAAADRLEGLASVTVLRSDYGLQIPSVPGVANVTDEVLLELEFVATP